MLTPVEVVFEGLDASPEAAALVRRHAAKLNAAHPFTSCRVVLTMPPRRRSGCLDVRVEVGGPGRSRSCASRLAIRPDELDAAIAGAFDQIGSQLPVPYAPRRPLSVQGRGSTEEAATT